MDAPLEDIAVLARSENRVAIIRALYERARTRRELKAEAGISRISRKNSQENVEC